MKISFTKMQGSGNDFILVDEWSGEVVAGDGKPRFVAFASDRHTGVGSDGVIFVQKSASADAKFMFYNPDGSLAEMCGNGIRCFAKYIYERGYVQKTELDVETLPGVKRLKLTLFNDVVEQVRVDMGAPQVKRGEAQVAGNPEDSFIDQEVVVDGTAYKVTSVGIGNPHAVLFVGDVEAVDVSKVGHKIRGMKKIFPHGVNVHFVKEEGRNEFRVRTYERGVEAETLACGTGICASAVAAVLTDKADLKKTVSFHTRGGDLSVEFELDGGEIKAVYLIGPAVEVFKGELDYNP